MVKFHFLSKRWVTIVLCLVAVISVLCLLIVSHQPSHSIESANLSLEEHPILRREQAVSLTHNKIAVPLLISASPTYTPTAAVTEAYSVSSRIILVPTLVSLGKPVTASVRGNLGPASVVTNERVDDWLKDRWQGRYRYWIFFLYSFRCLYYQRPRTCKVNQLMASTGC